MTVPPIIQILFYLPVGFWLLAKGGDWLVGGSAGVGRRIGMSSMAVGLTIVAWATSAPELVASCIAAQQGSPGIAMGNVLGSNVANIGLVLGASTLVLPAILGQRMGLREAFWLLASLGALWWVCFDKHVTSVEAVGLLAVFLIYNVHLWVTRSHNPADEPDIEGLEVPNPWRAVLYGSVAIAVGARLAILGAEHAAQMLGISDRVIGLTVIAIGTSLPELAAGLTTAFKGERGMGLGNVVGSNVFNSVVVIGVVALIVPMNSADAELAQTMENSIRLDFPVVLGFSVAAIFLPSLAGPKASRPLALVLLAAYAAYNFYLFAA